MTRKRRLYAVEASIQELLAVSHMVNRNNPPDYCGLDNCARERIGRNLCRAHYLQLYRWAKETGTQLDRTYTFEDLANLAKPVRGATLGSKDLACGACGDRSYARGLCQRHYLSWWRGKARECASV